jgi:pilus assembly protein CpaD
MTTADNIDPQRRCRGTAMRAAISAVAAAVLLLGGCREHLGLDDVTARNLSNAETRHPIGYSARTEALYVEVAPGGEGLSHNQQTDIVRFVERYKVEGTGRLTISAPGSTRGHLASSRSVRDVVGIAHGAGLPPEAIAEVRSKAGDGRFGPAVRLAYERPVAVAPQCGDWPEDIGENRERIPFTNFGCATQRNLALSVATGRDLQHPQEDAPHPGEKRTGVWTKFVGAPTGGGGASPATAPATAAPKPGATP